MVHPKRSTSYASLGSVAADIAANLPSDTLSGIVYLSGLWALNYSNVVITNRSSTPVQILQNTTALPEDVRLATLNLTDDVFEKLKILETASNETLNARRLRRWEVQNTWIGYVEHQSAQTRVLVLEREQDSGPLLALGKEGFPVLVLHGTQDALIDGQIAISVARGVFNNLRVFEIAKGGSHVIFHWNPEAVMHHIGAFAHEVYMA